MSSRTVLVVFAVGVVGVVGLAALALVACQRQAAPLPSSDTPLAVLERPLLGGGSFDSRAMAGKVVLVNFWSPG